LDLDYDLETLSLTLETASRLESILGNAACTRLLSQMRRLPSLPDLYLQITEELKTSNARMDVVAKLIAQDPLMTGKILQVVNSPYFGLGQHISEPIEAVMFLGVERIKSLILIAQVFTQVDVGKGFGFSMKDLWNHSLRVAQDARSIAQAEKTGERQSDLAFTGGLLHDLGKLLLAGNRPLEYARVIELVKKKGATPLEAELSVFQATHPELGASLLAIWGLPLEIIDAARWHHQPDQSEDQAFSVLTAVHAANVFANEQPAQKGAAPSTGLNAAYLRRLGLENRLDDWRACCISNSQAA
jgi:putative nucleotidyltransferase with HDIG domain